MKATDRQTIIIAQLLSGALEPEHFGVVESSTETAAAKAADTAAAELAK